jgi:hypothetical protein
VQPFDEVPKGSADFDGDGFDDIATTSGSNVVIHYSVGVGGFVGSEAFPTAGDSPMGLAVEDFDGDGFLTSRPPTGGRTTSRSSGATARAGCWVP